MSNPVHAQGDRVQIADDVSAAPAIPAAGAGQDISGLRKGAGSSPRQLITIARASTGPVTLTGPVVLYGEIDGVVGRIGELNDGNDIVVATGDGYHAQLSNVGLYDYIEIIAASVAGGGYDAWIQDIGGVS